MRKRAVWRELLDSVIQVRTERERIAAQIGVAPVTLTRWANGDTSPRLQLLNPLVQAIPDRHRAAFQASIEEDFPSHSFDEPILDDSMQPTKQKISVKVFISYAREDRELRNKLEEHLSWLKYSG